MTTFDSLPIELRTVQLLNYFSIRDLGRYGRVNKRLARFVRDPKTWACLLRRYFQIDHTSVLSRPICLALFEYQKDVHRMLHEERTILSEIPRIINLLLPYLSQIDEIGPIKRATVNASFLFYSFFLTTELEVTWRSDFRSDDLRVEIQRHKRGVSEFSIIFFVPLPTLLNQFPAFLQMLRVIRRYELGRHSAVNAKDVIDRINPLLKRMKMKFLRNEMYLDYFDWVYGDKENSIIISVKNEKK